tara:strand:- start:3943 stop:4230 length:288 start_codon:yes stop_codon:yes gene_type:complete
MSYQDLSARYPEYIAAIVLADKDIEPFIKKKKYLIPRDINFGSAMISIRKNIVMKSSDALIYMVDNRIISPNIMMRELQKKDFLYIKVCRESTFG